MIIALGGTGRMLYVYIELEDISRIVINKMSRKFSMSTAQARLKVVSINATQAWTDAKSAETKAYRE